MSTKENLEAAFAGESQANRRYVAFARKAEAEGLHQVARLFRAAAEAETIHALAHLRAIAGVKGTADNLEAAAAGEGYEFQQMYPKFLAAAQQEGVSPAVDSFRNAMAVERVHYGLYNEALKAVKSGGDLPAARMFVCEVCGNTVSGEAPDVCPICGAARSRFVEVK